MQKKVRDVVECDVWDRALLILCEIHHLCLAERSQERTLELLMRSDCFEIPYDGDEVGELHLGVHSVCGDEYAGLGLDAREERRDNDG